MKKIIYAFLAPIFGSFSCDSILEIQPDGNISGDIFNDSENIEKALVGAYFNLGGIADGIDGGELLGGDFIIMSTLLAHVSGFEIFWDRVNGFTYNNFADKEILTDNPRVLSNWRRAYEGIHQVNTILANIQNIESSEDQDRIQGEALAIRGIL